MAFSHHLNCLLFVVFHFLIVLNCFASDVFYRNPEPLQEKLGFVYRQERSLSNNDTDSQSIRPLHKKWQVGRVSRKQYEIINMLWRKTKVFIDVEGSTISNAYNNSSDSKNHNKRQEARDTGMKANFDSRPIFKSSTPSFIEFYYFDETEDLAKIKNNSVKKINRFFGDKETIKTANFVEGIQLKPHSPRISFRAHEPNIKQLAPTLKQNIKYKKQQKNPQESFPDTLSQPDNTKKIRNVLKFFKLTDLFNNITFFGKKLVTVKVYLNGSRVFTTKQTYKHELETTQSSSSSILTSSIKTTTAYDKIKFFEMYDTYTLLPQPTQNEDDDSEISSWAKDSLSHEKINLENVDQNIGHYNSKNKERYEKKHITYASFKAKSVSDNSIKPLQDVKTNTTCVVRDKSAFKINDKHINFVANMSKLAHWSDYPFVAVYVYEPTQAHCDAAGISPHWLIAAGSCLSRHHMVYSVDARSAFVTYCGANWRQPERIAYVKYSLVHPNFHPRDKAKRHIYNIGLIQVSNSMESSCNSWTPISLMSHQFATNPEGSTASAIGWGLDRFGTGDVSENLPYRPLMVYEGLVYSDSCPGSIAYSKAKRRDAESGANNVFCLLLPPYSGEEGDPVHGSLLLVGGKLIALYLQEERRPWGVQSAQYTGVWHLIPWVMETAREPDDEGDILFSDV